MKKKACTKCKVEKPLDDFVPHKQCRNGRAGVCKACQREYFSKWAKKHPGPVHVKPAPTHKVCAKCGLDQPIKEYVRDKNRTNGRYPTCRTCRIAYYEENRGRLCQQMAAYREANAASVLSDKQRYARKRFFYKRASNLLIRARNDGATLLPQCADLTTALSRLWKRQRGICPVTGRRLNRDNAQLDHIVPLKRGGRDEIENLRWVHRDVNYAKRDLLDQNFFRLCIDVVQHLNLI